MSTRVAELQAQLEQHPGKSEARVDIVNQLAWEVWSTDATRAENYALQGRREAEELNYTEGIMYAQRNQALIHYWKGELTDAVPLTLEVLEWFVENKKTADEAQIRQILGSIYWGFGDFQKAFDSVMEATRLYHSLDDISGQAWSLFAIGTFHFDSKDYRPALANYTQALHLFKKTDQKSGEARALNGLGNIYLATHDYQAALKYQQQSIDLHRHENNRLGESKSLNDTGIIYRTMGNLDKALSYFEESLALRVDLKYMPGQTTTHLDIAEVHLANSDIANGREHANQGLELAKKFRAAVKVNRAHTILARLAETENNLSIALEHYKAAHEISIETFREDADKKLDNLKSTHQIETSRRDAELHRLKNEELDQRNRELERGIAELEAAQVQLVQTTKMASLANLLSGVAHDIELPLNSLVSAVEFNEKITTSIRPQSAGETNKKLERTLHILGDTNQSILSASRRIAKTVSILQQFDYSEDGKPELLDIHRCLEQVLQLIAHEVPEDIAVHTKYDDPIQLHGYANQLNQVFLNLLLNAIEAIEGSGQISISTARKDSYAVVRIDDTGRGMSEDILSELFEPGFSINQSRVKMRTGLYSTYQIVSQHRGTIEVNSTPGQGSSFQVSLPLN